MARRLPAEIGEVIGGYRLAELLSRGGMGAVYLATHAVLGRQAVVKVLERSLASDEEYVHRFLSEAKIVNDVRHDNIVDIFDFVQTKNPTRVACIMEHIDGVTLQDALSERTLTAIQAVNAMLQLIDPLREVHARGVIHRDLKPTNIMVVGSLFSDLSDRPSVKILDFGIAKVVASSVVKTGPGEMLGTPAYMAPEQVSGDGITPATDVYALGELFYEMLSGVRLFATGTANQIIRNKVLGEIPPMRLPSYLIDADLVREVIARSVAVEPSRRPQMDELASMLEEIGEKNAQAETQPMNRPEERIAPPPAAAFAPAVAAPAPPAASAPTQPSAAPQEVRKLGDYYIFAELPARGMTQAFVARKEGQVEICVLKRLLQNLEDNPTAVARFGREAKIAARLEHPRIARMMDASVQEHTFCIASELIIGQPLDAILARLVDGGTLMPLQVVAPLFLGILDGLAYAHGAVDAEGRPLSIVHRDLTPAAIVVAFAGDVKIRDFGVARASVDDFKTAPGMAVGSIEYMSPEQARSSGVDRRSDLYTLSTVLYETLTNRPVVSAGNVLETLKSVTGGKPKPLAEVRPDLPAALCAIVERGLAKDPAQRWQSAAEYRAALANGFGRFSDATLDVAGDFLRGLMPEEEEKAVELLGRIREIGERLPAPRSRSRSSVGLDDEGPAYEPTMTVRRRKAPADSAPEEMEPSVMTMPGAPAPLDRGSSIEQRPSAPVASAPSRRRAWVIGSVASVAAVLLLGLAIAKTGAERPQPLIETVTPEAPPPVPKVAQKEAVAAVEPIPVPPPPAAVAPPPPFKAKPKPRKSVRRRAVPAPATKPVNRAPPPPPVKRSVPYAGIRRKLETLRANPKDVKLFDQVHAAIARQARDLPATSRRRVKVDLDAAERTYDVELLSSALNKMALERAKTR